MLYPLPHSISGEYVTEKELGTNVPPHDKSRYSYIEHNVRRLLHYSTVGQGKMQRSTQGRDCTYMKPTDRNYFMLWSAWISFIAAWSVVATNKHFLVKIVALTSHERTFDLD